MSNIERTLHGVIREALQHYHCTHWQQDEDNGGLPLPDALTPPWGDGTVRMGMEEIDLIADEVADALDALGKPFCWCVESTNSADWAFAATKEGVQSNAKLMDRDCIKSEPFPLYRAAVESLAPKENQRVFAVNVLGTPMREYEPGKWEVARWPSLAAPAGDEWQAEFERLRRRVEDVYFAWMMPCKENDAQTQLYRNLNKARASLLAHARQRVQPASEEQPEPVHLVRGDAERPDGSEGWRACAGCPTPNDCRMHGCGVTRGLWKPTPIPSTAPASPGPDVESASAPAADEQALPVVRGSHIKASMFHDAGAVARCSYCRRYSDDPATLSDRQPLCDCGKRHGWCGSFVAPTADSKWSGASPVSAPEPAGEKEASQRLLRECLETMQWAIEWDKARDFLMPYRVRDPIHAAIAELREHLGDDKANATDGVKEDQRG